MGSETGSGERRSYSLCKQGVEHDNGAYAGSILASFRLDPGLNVIDVPPEATHYVTEEGIVKSITFYDCQARADLLPLPEQCRGKKMKIQI